MSRFLAILDNWLVLITATLFVWTGITGIYSRSSGMDVGVALLAGILGIVLVGGLCRWRDPSAKTALLVLRLGMIAALAYYAWFQERPWLSLDDSALVRGSFQREFLLQRLWQVGFFLLLTMPMVVMGIWHGSLLPRMPASRADGRGRGVGALVAFVVVAGTAARLVGVPKLGPLFWILGSLAVGLLLADLARRIAKAELSAVVAFAVFAFAMPVVMLWP
jgi:hypothetical protein